MAERAALVASDDAREVLSRAVLDTLHQQAILSLIYMTPVVVTVAGLALRSSPALPVFAWAGTSLLVMTVRCVMVRRLCRPGSAGARRRLRYVTAQAFVTGLVLTTSIAFFPAMSEGARSMYTIVWVGVMSGFIVSSHGYPPILTVFAGPMLSALAIGWTVFPLEGVSGAEQASLAVLMVVFGTFLLVSSREVFRAFERNVALAGELREALDAETEANAAKTRFLAAASHDLRQPLHTMSMLGAALTLRPLDAESASIARRIDEAMVELSTELDSLLDISKLDAGVTRARSSLFELEPLVERLVADYRPAAREKGLCLHARLLARPALNCDRGLLERVLRNLLDNAIKYTDAGSVVLEVAVHDAECSIRVIDTGLGIPQGEQARVHEEFYQLHNPERDRRKGLGLGLSIVRRIAPLLQATLALRSVPGEGTTFSVTLPCTSAPRRTGRDTAAAGPSSTPPDRVDALAGVHALIVEDDTQARLGMRTLLESVRVRVSEASGTRLAVSCARADAPDIALIDLRLPDGDSGHESIKALRALDPSLPIIVVSGELSGQHEAALDAAGCDYLVKPVDMATLFKRMQRLLQPREDVRSRA